MKLSFPGFCYCIDTSALIDLRWGYPRDVFPSAWKNLEGMVHGGRLVAPHEVIEELRAYQGKDELLEWAGKNKRMFKRLDGEQLGHVGRIVRSYPRFVDVSKTTPEADPFVVALARIEGCTVVASEKFAQPGGRPRIPDVCRAEGIECISLLDLFRTQGWKY